MSQLFHRSGRLIFTVGLSIWSLSCSLDEGDASALDQPTTLMQAAESECLPPSRDNFASAGPYGVKTKNVTIGRLGQYTIFYPDRFAEGCQYPVVAWGNGTGVSGTQSYEHWQRRFASWGMIAIASHSATSALDNFLAGAVDYMIEQGTVASSEFYGKIGPRGGLIGHSQGGLEAVSASTNRNVKAVVNVQGTGQPARGVPVLVLTGTEDFARELATDTYEATTGPAFLADLQAASHVGTPVTSGANTPNGKLFVQLGTAWFRCFLGEDDTACQLFRGGKDAPACKLGNYATCDGRNFP